VDDNAGSKIKLVIVSLIVGIVATHAIAATQPPSIPTNVMAVPVTNTEIRVSWNASQSDIGIAGYNVYQDSKLVTQTNNTKTAYTITGLIAPTKHVYTVSAYDTTGATSALSTGATGSIPSGGIETYDQMILADHPVAFWNVDPTSATESDLTGNGNVGTYKDGVPTTATMPNGDISADFDSNGSSQYLTVPSNASFSISTTGSLTWEAWVRADTLQFPNLTSDYADFMGKCATYSPTCEWEARMYNAVNPENRSSRISAYVFNPTAGLGSAADWQPTAGTIQANQWVYVVGEYTTQSQPSNCANAYSYPGSINIWVNGVEWSQVSHSPTGCMSQFEVKPQIKNSPLNIGAMAIGSWFKGAVGKVAIYNYDLSSTQIAAHYASMTGRTPDGSCGATCSW
jgi:hypothetical protein